MLYSAWTKGTKHIEKHKPRQDCFVTYQDDTCTILIVADGHGGEPYVRSGLGARIACNVALKVLKNDLCTEQYAQTIKVKFDTLVKKHLSLKPLTAFEIDKLGNLPREYSYGTTLLAVKITDTGITILQLGDGKIHLINKNGSIIPTLPEDTNYFGSGTSSLVQENAIEKCRFVHYPDTIACVLMYSDGFEPKGEYPWTILEKVNPKYSNDELKQELLDGDKYGDDQTIVLYLDEKQYDSTLFHEGIETSKKSYLDKKQLLKLQNKLTLLETFLASALEKYKGMSHTEAESFKIRSIEPRYQEYIEIKRQLATLTN